METIEFIFADMDDVTSELRHKFPRCGSLSGDIRRTLKGMNTDAVLCPTNSYGLMNCGVAGAYRDFFGAQVEERVRGQIERNYQGLISVGRANYVRTGHPHIPNLVYAPTSRVGGLIYDGADVYLAYRAALLECRAAHFRRVIVPGFGSGVGGMHPGAVAHLLWMAWRDVFCEPFWPENWRDVQRHLNLMKEWDDAHN